MTIEQVLSILESPARSESVRKAISKVEMAELAPVYFARVAELSGQDPQACIRLSRRFAEITELPYALRAKAVGERAQGRWSEAADSFLQAGESCDGLNRFIFSLGAIDSLARAGKPAQAVEYGREAILALAEGGNLAMAARAHINVGNALAWQDLNQDARGHYRAALDHLPEEAISERAMAHLGLSTAELYSGDPEIALSEAELARDAFEDLGLTYRSALARLNLAQAKTMLGQSDAAVPELLELREELKISTPDQVRISEFLGDAYLKLNLYEEAQAAFESALADRNLHRMPLNLANSHYGLGRALAPRNQDGAARHFRYAARAYRKAGNRVWELASLAQEAWLRKDRGARERMQGAIAELRVLKADYLAEEATTFAAQVGWAPLGDAPHSFLLQWRHQWLKAKHSSDKLEAYRETFALIERDRLMVRSSSAAMHFLDDRGQAISEYLECLLVEPTPDSVDEAISVLSRTRSVALVEEILSARARQLPAQALRELDELRTQLTQDASPGSRFQSAVSEVTASREWTEMTWRILESSSNAEVSLSQMGDVWVDTGNQVFQLASSTSRPCSLSPSELRSKLNWLEFSLFEPLINRDCGHVQLDKLLGELGAHVLHHGGPICPDGVMWRMPWTLLSDNESILQLNPAFGSGVGEFRLPKVPSVNVWLGSAEDLPELESELAAITQIFPQAKVLRTREEIRGSYLSHTDIIHVMAHARINKDSPMFSFLQLPDGPLYATEIARSGISTNLAMVAACQTGTMRANLAYEPEGIVRSFLACGAVAAVGSLWPLDDRFSAQFMKHFYDSLASGENLINSMKVARATGRQMMPHPYFWGSMALFGGYTTP